jgi:hypothetical protein
MSTEPPTATSSRKLTLRDIADTRAYERERSAFRAQVVELKRRRRLSLGPVVTLVFENRETIRFQIQEMARVERIATDVGIQDELDTYNPLVPEPGQLCATLFLELTTDDELRHWLPRLMGIERAVLFRLPDGEEVRSLPDPQHASQLTRDHVTAAVHYVTFSFTDAQIDAFGAGAMLAIDHPDYVFEIMIGHETLAELQRDLRV